MSKLEEERKDENMLARLKKKNVDIGEIKRQYISGIGIDKIAMIHRLSDDEIDWILKKYMSRENQNAREKNREKFKALRFEVGIPDHSDRKYWLLKNNDNEEVEHEL